MGTVLIFIWIFNSFLKNNSDLVGVPLSKKDGLTAGNGKMPVPTFFDIDSAMRVFNNTTIGSLFYTKNGAWGCLGGAAGHDSLTSNRVLIAQLTTNGELSFELNIQIGSPNGTIEKYVAKNPLENEILFTELQFNSHQIISTNKKIKPLNKNN